MKKLAVPYVGQTPGKNDCMVACLKMAFDFYGVDDSYETMRDRFTYNSVGLSMPQIGQYAIDKGLKSEIVLLNPHLFSVKDIDKTQDQILQQIQSRSFKNPEAENVRKDFEAFMHKGGVVSARVPTKKEVVASIDADIPVIIMLVSTLLQNHRPGYNFHANMIYGYDDTHFYIHDPETPELGGGTHRCEQDLVMYAMAVMGHADVDNAGFMIVKS